MTHTNFTVGSLYLVGFTQARAPHVGLLIATSASSGRLVHIRIDRATSRIWTYQSRAQKVAGDMFCATLLKIRDVTASAITVQQLEEAAESIPAPQNDDFGECFPWVLRVVQALKERGLLNVMDVELLGMEFAEFAAGNQAFARRDRFPNVAVSDVCT